MKIYYKKEALLVMISFILIGCSNTPVDFYEEDGPVFNWMPEPLLWERNIRDCRSQPQCNAADLFQRT